MFSDVALEHFKSLCDFFYTHKNKVLFDINEEGYKKIERKNFHLTFTRKNGRSTIVYEGMKGMRWEASMVSGILYLDRIEQDEFIRTTIQDLLIYG